MKHSFLDKEINLFEQADFLPYDEYKQQIYALAKILLIDLKVTKFYKYYAPDKWERETKNHKNGTVWFSHSDCFNDPFEFCYSSEGLPLTVRESDVYKEHKGHQKSCYVYCLSERNDSTLMWAHYSNCHKGFCVEFSAKEVFESYLHFLYPVIYTQVPVRAVDNLFSPYSFSVKPLVSKGIDWAYEREWRILKYFDDSTQKGHLSKFPKPTAYYLGCMAQADFEEETKKYCFEHKVPLYRMEQKEDAFSLKARLLI